MVDVAIFGEISLFAHAGLFALSGYRFVAINTVNKVITSPIGIRITHLLWWALHVVGGIFLLWSAKTKQQAQTGTADRINHDTGAVR